MRRYTLSVIVICCAACARMPADSRPRTLDLTHVTDPSDPDIALLSRLQLKLAEAIAPLDSVAPDSLMARDVRMINAGDQVFHKNEVVPFCARTAARSCEWWTIRLPCGAMETSL